MTNSLIAVAINLIGMLLIYSLMANAITRFQWHGRGAISVIAMILVAGLFWIVPPFALALADLHTPPGALWLSNWLISACSVVILCQRVRWIPRALEDLARMDGCGWLGTYRHIVFPLIRRELALIAFLTVMATSLLLWIDLGAPARELPPWLYLLLPAEGENGRSLAGNWPALITGSIVTTLPVLLIFLFAKRYLQHPAEARTNP